MEQEILQIIPSDKGDFALADNPNTKGTLYIPVMAWALIDKEGYRYVVGMVARDGANSNKLTLATEIPGFKQYSRVIPELLTTEKAGPKPAQLSVIR